MFLFILDCFSFRLCANAAIGMSLMSSKAHQSYLSLAIAVILGYHKKEYKLENLKQCFEYPLNDAP